MKKTKEMDIVFLLDRSGSMSGSEQDTIGGYNSYIKKMKKNNITTKVTTILFDDQYEVITNRKDINNIKNITDKEYYVRGCTALYDAIGKTINNLDKEINNNKVLFIITTDGLENSSKEYNRKSIQKLIKNHSNWEFLYIGANIDSYSEGQSIGISSNNIANYKKDRVGTSKLFDSVARASIMYKQEECLDSSWKENLMLHLCRRSMRS